MSHELARWSIRGRLRDKVLREEFQHFPVPVWQLVNQGVDSTNPVVLVVRF